jgi:hypothetical protein
MSVNRFGASSLVILYIRLATKCVLRLLKKVAISVRLEQVQIDRVRFYGQ